MFASKSVRIHPAAIRLVVGGSIESATSVKARDPSTLEVGTFAGAVDSKIVTASNVFFSQGKLASVSFFERSSK